MLSVVAAAVPVSVGGAQLTSSEKALENKTGDNAELDNDDAEELRMPKDDEEPTNIAVVNGELQLAAPAICDESDDVDPSNFILFLCRPASYGMWMYLLKCVASLE